MASYHLRLKFMSRKGGDGSSAVHGAAYRSGGKGATVSQVEKVGGVSAVAAAAYRSGEALRDDRQGRSYDYTAKDHIAHTEIILPEGNMPEWASSRAQLWNEVERAEKRKDATVAREVEISLPRELSLAENIALVRGFMLEQFVSKGLVVDFAIHEPKASDGDKHIHAHCMITPRALTESGFAAKKDQTFWFVSKGDKSKEALNGLRAAWADRQNDALARKGASARVDHRTLMAQRTDALARADQARAQGRPQEAAQHAQAARSLNRVPQVPLGLSRRLSEVTGHLKDRIGLWMQKHHYHRLAPEIAALEARGKAELYEFANRVRKRTVHAFGVLPPAPDRGMSYDR